MDLITLALAKKYTDEQVGSGGGGSAEIPYFDINDLIGEDHITVDGQWHYSEGMLDLTELTTALAKGAVTMRVRFHYQEGGMMYLDDANLVVCAGYTSDQISKDPKDRFGTIYGIAVLDFKHNDQPCPCAYEIVVSYNTSIGIRAVQLVDIKDEEEELVFDLTAFDIPDISYLLEGVPIDAEMFIGAYMLAKEGAVKLVYNSGGKKHSGTYPSFIIGDLDINDFANTMGGSAVCIQAPVYDGTTVVNGYLVGSCEIVGTEYEFTLKYVTTA